MFGYWQWRVSEAITANIIYYYSTFGDMSLVCEAFADAKDVLRGPGDDDST